MASVVRKLPSLPGVNHRSGRKTSKASLEDALVSGKPLPLTREATLSKMSPEAHAAMALTREDTNNSISLRSRPSSLPRVDSNTTIKNKVATNINKRTSEVDNCSNPINKNLTTQPTLSPISRHKYRQSANKSSEHSENPLPDPTTVSEFDDSGFGSVRHQPQDLETFTHSALATSSITTADVDTTNNNSINEYENLRTGTRRQLQHRPLSRLSRIQLQFARGKGGNNGKSENKNKQRDAEKIFDNEDDRLSLGKNLEDIVTDAVLGCQSNTDQPKSFVLALDAALEANCVQRLHGDITDRNGGSGQPGTVRALNGGRLSNAQEVVVNVCHGECEKELVFHDDDDDSLDTARAASEIRIHTWMEYNEGFPQDEVEEIFDLDVTGENDRLDTKSSLSTTNATNSKSPNVKVTLRAPTARPRTAVKPTESQTPPSSAAAGTRGSKPPLAYRRDANNNTLSPINKVVANKQNNNSAGSKRSKPGTASGRDNSSSRFGSAISNDGSSKRSANSSAPKRESFLSRKAKS